MWPGLVTVVSKGEEDKGASKGFSGYGITGKRVRLKFTKVNKSKK